MSQQAFQGVGDEQRAVRRKGQAERSTAGVRKLGPRIGALAHHDPTVRQAGVEAAVRSDFQILRAEKIGRFAAQRLGWIGEEGVKRRVRRGRLKAGRVKRSRPIGGQHDEERERREPDDGDTQHLSLLFFPSLGEAGRNGKSGRVSLPAR